VLQLVAYLPNEVQRFPLSRRLSTLGSSSDCDIRLPFPGIAEHHARLERDADFVLLENLCADGSILVNGESTDAARLQVLDEIRLGRVTLLLEDRRPEPALQGSAEPVPAVRDARPRPSRQLLLERLSMLSDWVLNDAQSADSLESPLRTLLEDFGGGACFLFHGERRPLAVRLAVVTDPRWLAVGENLFDAASRQTQPNRSIGHVECMVDGRPRWLCYRASSALDRRYLALFAFDHFQPRDWSPEIGLAVIADLIVLGLVHHVGRYEPILPGRAGQRGVTLAPGFIVGPAAATELLLTRLRAAVDAACHVLVQGEEGSGRELVARTLHLSGSRRDGPFVVASCEGDAKAVEADLFGAEVAGRKEPLRRDGKLLLASQGTLYLDSVDSLPLDLQARLVRVLRSAELEGPAPGELHRVDLRIVASSRVALLSLVSRGRFRADLAHRLGELTIDVPPLRGRMEDLPILVQTYVNRFSHETGKRVRGITMQALSTLARYPFPGNLRELENAVRQMVYLSIDQVPMDVDLMPAEIRAAGLAEPRAESSSELELSSLVASVERAAIKEALRRTSGNKAHAARLLGLSRNGLAQKMSRYQM
jgi:transcriptional regulator with AAA-type ATPase domain